MALAAIGAGAGEAPAQTAVPLPPGLQMAPAPAVPDSNPLPGLPPVAGWEPRQKADLQALDKVDDKTATLSIPINQSGQFGHLTITVRSCLVRPADQPADAAAYLDIVDPRPNAPGFHGWLLANEPAASMLQHPVYDVRLLGCH